MGELERITLKNGTGCIVLDPATAGRKRIVAEALDQGTYIHRREHVTNYPVDLIKLIFDTKGVEYCCDEIAREEDPKYVRPHLERVILSQRTAPEFAGQRLLDFGCGAGASTSILARMLPDTEIVGVELQERLLEVARKRVAHYGFDNVTLLVSPDCDAAPSDIGTFDAIVFAAVYEHLLPIERAMLMPVLWSMLRPSGLLFIDETPNRWFPIESHTTDLPFINYLPNWLARPYALACSKRTADAVSWEKMLRLGIRGGTPKGILRDLRRDGGAPGRLCPAPPFQGRLRQTASLIYNATGLWVLPYLSFAVLKEG
jgi:2-polyprenyl-3-methyl-5-hydroxy-6-metoxy-1,4-benzoquinol methylase